MLVVHLDSLDIHLTVLTFARYPPPDTIVFVSIFISQQLEFSPNYDGGLIKQIRILKTFQKLQTSNSFVEHRVLIFNLIFSQKIKRNFSGLFSLITLGARTSYTDRKFHYDKINLLNYNRTMPN